MAYMIISHPDPSPCVVCRVDYANLQFEMTHAPVGTSYGLLSQCPPLCRTRRKLQHGVETLPESQSQGSKHRVQISAATQWRLNCHQVCHRGHCYSPARVEKKQKHWKKNNPRLRDNNCRYTLSGDANQNHSPTFGKLPEKKHPDIFQKKKKHPPDSLRTFCSWILVEFFETHACCKVCFVWVHNQAPHALVTRSLQYGINASNLPEVWQKKPWENSQPGPLWKGALTWAVACNWVGGWQMKLWAPWKVLQVVVPVLVKNSK